MPKRSYPGEMELMVLLAVMRLGDAAYGVPISKELLLLCQQRSRSWQHLRGAGQTGRDLGDPTPERGGRAKRYFDVTSTGVKALKTTRAALTNLWTGIPLLEGKGL